jgi:hypothetical protein
LTLPHSLEAVSLSPGPIIKGLQVFEAARWNSRSLVVQGGENLVELARVDQPVNFVHGQTPNVAHEADRKIYFDLFVGGRFRKETDALVPQRTIHMNSLNPLSKIVQIRRQV